MLNILILDFGVVFIQVIIHQSLKKQFVKEKKSCIALPIGESSLIGCLEKPINSVNSQKMSLFCVFIFERKKGNFFNKPDALESWGIRIRFSFSILLKAILIELFNIRFYFVVFNKFNAYIVWLKIKQNNVNCSQVTVAFVHVICECANALKRPNSSTLQRSETDKQ